MSRSLFIIIILSFLLRLIMFGGIFVSLGEKGLFFNDSTNFYRTAINLAEDHGFSREAGPPYTPSAHFPPFYPLLLAGSLKVSDSLIPLIILQIILSSLIPLLIWKIGEFFTKNKRSLAIAAGLSGFEPMMALWSVTVLTEVVSVFSLLLALLFFIKIFSENSFTGRNSVLAGLFLGLSTLTRPHAQLLFLPATILLLGIWGWKKFKLKTEKDLFLLKGAGVFAVTFFLVLSPWLMRNWYQFNTFSVATTGARNFYTSLGTSVISFEKNLSYEDAQTYLDEEFRKKYNTDPKEIRENPAWGPHLAKDGIALMFDYPASTVKVLAITLNSFFTQDLYLTYTKYYGLMQPIPFGFSPSVVLVKEGPIALAKLVFGKFGLYSIIPLLGRALWIALTIFWVLGVWKAFRAGGKTRFFGVMFFLIILYYASGSLLAGFSDHGRHRYPANPFIFLLAGYGLASFLKTRGS